MLDYSFSLIQCFYQTGFRCPAILVFLSEIHKRFLLSIGQQGEYPFGSPIFSLIFLGAVREKRRGDISVIYFTYIVDETHEQGFPRIQLRVVFQHYAGKECQVPGMLLWFLSLYILPVKQCFKTAIEKSKIWTCKDSISIR